MDYESFRGGIYIYMYIYIYIYIYIYMIMSLLGEAYICVFSCIHKYICDDIVCGRVMDYESFRGGIYILYIYIYIYIYIYVCFHICIYVCIYIYKYIYIHI
jgi:hypothetical protein